MLLLLRRGDGASRVFVEFFWSVARFVSLSTCATSFFPSPSSSTVTCGTGEELSPAVALFLFLSAVGKMGGHRFDKLPFLWQLPGKRNVDTPALALCRTAVSKASSNSLVALRGHTSGVSLLGEGTWRSVPCFSAPLRDVFSRVRGCVFRWFATSRGRQSLCLCCTSSLRPKKKTKANGSVLQSGQHLRWRGAAEESSKNASRCYDSVARGLH